MKNDRRNQLQSFYAANRLLVSNFCCQHAAACRKAAVRDLYRGSEAHVGCRYGEGLRVVVVSLDTGGKGESLDKRCKTIQSLYRPDGDTLHMNPHMRGTTQLLKAIYGPDNGNLYELYAMTNAAKCSRADPGSAKVPRVLYENCSEFVVPELACLDPQMIVTQGNEAWRALRAGDVLSAAHKADLEDWVAHQAAGVVVRDWLRSLAREYLRTVSVADRDVPTLKTIHPSARAGQWHRFVRTALQPVVTMAKHIATQS